MSVRLSVRPSVTHELKSCKSAVFDQNYWQYERGRILCRVYGLVKSIDTKGGQRRVARLTWRLVFLSSLESLRQQVWRFPLHGQRRKRVFLRRISMKMRRKKKTGPFSIHSIPCGRHRCPANCSNFASHLKKEKVRSINHSFQNAYWFMFISSFAMFFFFMTDILSSSRILFETLERRFSNSNCNVSNSSSPIPSSSVRWRTVV